MGCDIHPYAERRTEAGWERIPIKLPDDRNYISFAKLVGVRSGSGFGDEIVPISEPRGIPSDTSVRDTQGVDYDDPAYVWLGDHSHSWVTLDELLALNWNETITKRGIVPSDVAENVRKYNYQPGSWCQGRSDMEGHEWAEWTMPLREALHTLPQMVLALLPYSNGRPQDIRIVFGFDS